MSTTSGTDGGDIAGSSPISKWQFALMVGAPVALGLGYMYYRNNSRTSNPKDRRGKPKSATTTTTTAQAAVVRENGASTEKQISIDGNVDDRLNQVPSFVVETPLQEAQKYKDKGNKLFKMGKYDKAIAEYNRAIEVCPKKNTEEMATFYQNRAAAYEQLKKYDAVKVDCTKAIEFNPKYTKALLRRARAQEHVGELESAFEDVTATCIYENFSNHVTLQWADRLLREIGKQHVQENLAKKKFTMPSKHFIKTYMLSFPNDPVFSVLERPLLENIPPMMKKPLQALKNETYDDIIPLCTEAIDSVESKALSGKMETLLLRATFLLLLGKHDAAIGDLDVIINSEETSEDVRINALIKRATLYMQLENSKMTFSDFESAIKIDATHGDIYHHRGQVNLLLNNVHEAKSDFEKVVRYNPDFAIGYMQKCYTDYRFALFNRNMESLEVAMKKFEEALEKFPDGAEGYMLYAQMMSETQEYEKADRYFRKAMEKDPENANLYVHMGLLQLQWNGNDCNGVERAVEYIKKALELDEKCELGYETLGSIEVQRGNLQEAIKLFDKALELCRTCMELTHLYSLRDATRTQLNLKKKLGLDMKSVS